MIINSLKEKTLNGIAWSAIEKVIIRIIQFLIGIIIARILMPSDYGLVGMVLIFITLSNMFIDCGFSQALVQKQDRTSKDICSVFFFNVIISFICYIFIFFLAPLVADFYEISLLKNLLRVLGLGLIINSFSSIQRTLLIIRIDFKTSAIVNILSSLISGSLGIYLAYNNYGVWSIVGQTLSAHFVSLVLLWIFGGWIPKLTFSYHSIKKLWQFGSRLLVAGTISTIIREINSIIIGKFYKASELGFYHRAVQTTDLVSSTTNEVINSVTFPILSMVQQDKERLISIYKRMLTMTAFFIFPVMTFMSIMSEHIIKFLLTDKWLAVVPLMQWLCFARILTPINSINMNILNAIGRSDLFLKVDVFKIPIVLGIMLFTLPISVKAVVIGNLVSTVLAYFINIYYPYKLYGIGIKSQVLMIYKIFINTIIMVLFTLLAVRCVNVTFYKLIIGCIVAFLTYVLGAYCLKLQQLYEVIDILSKKLNK